MAEHSDSVDDPRAIDSMTPEGVRQIRQSFARYVEQAERAGLEDALLQARFAASIGLSDYIACLIFGAPKCMERGRAWVRRQLLTALEEIQRGAKIRDDISLTKMADTVGVTWWFAQKLIGDEWRVARAALPTARERVLATINALVEANIPARELTEARIYAEAGVSPYHGTWFQDARRDAVRILKEGQVAPPIERPVGVEVRTFDNGWVDISGDTFDLRFASSGGVLHLDRLRTDLAEIAWSLLRDDLRMPDIAPGTIRQHYNSYKLAGRLLGEETSDVRQACLEDVQRAWARYDGPASQKKCACWALKKLFGHLARDRGAGAETKADEARRIVRWLDAARASRPVSSQVFLSADEMKAVYRGCMADIKAGVLCADTYPDLLQLSTTMGNSRNAVAIIRWGDALCVLLFAFTALRPASVIGIKTGDWSRVRAGLYALAWSHSKKSEENAVALYEGLALLLNQYVERTASIRASIGTAHVFLGPDGRGGWKSLNDLNLRNHIYSFVRRHGLTRDGGDLPLGPTIQRRTYVTRGLAEGKTIAALAAQLGHTNIRTTLHYAKHNRFEHPSKVGPGLDHYGRESLALWVAPRRLEDLSPRDRAEVLRVRVERDQGVGLCGHERCVMVDDGAPPPCSLCKNLLSGPEFRPAWDRERTSWRRRIARLEADPASGNALSQVVGLYDTFEQNYSYIYGKGDA